MIDTNLTASPTFIDAVRARLAEACASGALRQFSCNASQRREYSSTFINGIRHSKAPLQNNLVSELDLQLVLADGKVAALVFHGQDLARFERRFAQARALGADVSHAQKLVRQEGYPELALVSPELLGVFERDEAVTTLARIAGALDARASAVRHALLMNYEVSASLAITQRRYFDSVSNDALEISASCGLMCSFSLTDTSEYFADAMGVLPSDEDCANVVAEAAKNLVSTAVRKFEPRPGAAVLLSPKAVGSLFSSLVFPNLEARSILDGTGAYGAARLGKMVLEGVTIEDDPHLAHSPFSSAFDAEGTPTRPVTIMKDGSLSHPLFTSALLSELEEAHPEFRGRFALTGHAESSDAAGMTNHRIRIAPGVARSERPDGLDCETWQAMLGLAPQVVLVSNLTGMSVDPLTGQFALDAEGAKVHEGGALVYSTSVTLRGNLFEALRGADKRTGPSERVYSTWAPWLLTRDLTCVSKELATETEA